MMVIVELASLARKLPLLDAHKLLHGGVPAADKLILALRATLGILLLLESAEGVGGGGGAS